MIISVFPLIFKSQNSGLYIMFVSTNKKIVHFYVNWIRIGGKMDCHLIRRKINADVYGRPLGSSGSLT